MFSKKFDSRLKRDKRISKSSVILLLLTVGMLPSKSLADPFPERPKLTIADCEGERLGELPPTSVGPAVAIGVGSILISAAITAGIDFIGERLTEASQESMTTRTASINISPDGKHHSAQCITFMTAELANTKDGPTTDKSVELTIKLEGLQTSNPIPIHMIPELTNLKYHRTLTGKLNKERGLMVQLAVSRPGTTSGESQTINLGNLNTQNTSYMGHVKFPTMANPYASVSTDKMGKTTTRIGGPFTISVTLTEVKDANRALGFVASTFSQANDGLTSAITTAVNGN